MTVEAQYLTHNGIHPKTGRQRHAFWCAYTDERPDGGYRVAVNFGTLGTGGQTQIKDFKSRGQASEFVDRKITEKLNEGYQEHSRIPDDVRIKGAQLLDLPKPEAFKTANLLAVCEASVSTAVDAVTSDRQLSVEQMEAVQAARRAMTELRRRFAELEAQAELIDALFSQKVSA